MFRTLGLLRSVRNTFAGVIVVPAGAVAVGLTVAVLADRLRRAESLAKSLTFLPMAVSFVEASVIWGFMYDFRSFGNQTGPAQRDLDRAGQRPRGLAPRTGRGTTSS